jgi:hypothetical protein
MMTYQLTKHAEERVQQRAIPVVILNLAIEFAEEMTAADHAKCLYFSQRSCRRMRAAGVCRKAIELIEKKKNLRIIVAGGTVITAMYAHQNNRRIRRNA